MGDIFVGREHELGQLSGLVSKKSASLVVIKGRRRIGKSRLIKEFAKDYKHIKLTGLAPAEGVNAAHQIQEFTTQLCEQVNLPNIKYDSWHDALNLLAREVSQGRVIVSLDEISWIASNDPLFLSKLKTIWDEKLKDNPELILILSGSISSWIEENILSSTGFFGRISLVMNLSELSLLECNQFFDMLSFKGSEYEKLQILSITGGVPRYLEEIRSDLTAAENIKRMCFYNNGILYREFNDIFSDLFNKKQDFYKKIVRFLSTGSKSLSEVAEYLKLKKNGDISSYLNHLVQSGFVTKDNTWNIKTKQISKLAKYRLSDNYLRFYLKYIEPNILQIQQEGFRDVPMSSLRGYDSIMGLQFENLVLGNGTLLMRYLNIYPSEVIFNAPYFQRETTRYKSCQIDCLIQTKANILYICEIKFSRSPVGIKAVEELELKANRLVLPRGYSVRLVLVHVNGAEDNVDSSKYPLSVVDFSKFL